MTLEASTLLGGVSSDDIQAVSVAPDGTVYVVGTTTSSDFPVTAGAFDTERNGQDAFVARFDADLTTLLAATFLGGDLTEFGSPDASDSGYGVAVSPDGVFVVGSTTAFDFPMTAGGAQPENNSELGYPDAFVARLSFDLSSLTAATYIGATKEDIAFDVAIDPQGDVVVAGTTNGGNFPITPGAYSTNTGGVEGPFITRLSPDLSAFEGSTRLGASAHMHGLAIEPVTGDVFIVGSTRDRHYPSTVGAFDPTCGTDGICNFVHTFNSSKDDAYVSRMSRDMTTLVASTFLGGSRYDYATAIAWTSSGIAIGGSSDSNGFPITSGAYQPDRGPDDRGYVTLFDPMLTTVRASTYLGGVLGHTAMEALHEDPETGGILVAGYTTGNDYPITTDAFDQAFTGEFEQFLSMLTADLTALPFSTFFGGTDINTGNDDPIPSVYALAFDDDRGLYMAGVARADNFQSVPGSYQMQVAGDADGFVTRISTGPGTTTANDPVDGLPGTTQLLPNYPNPFNPSTSVRFDLAQAGAVRVAVYDALGRHVALLQDGRLEAGTYTVSFDAAQLPSGSYLVRMEAEGVAQTQTITLLK